MLKTIHPRLCELGKIKIGGLGEWTTSKNGKKFRPPRKDDHFTITTMMRNAEGDLLPDDELMKKLEAQFGSPLRTLPIILLSDDIDEVLAAQYARYDGKTCIATCDGETCKWNFDKAGVEIPGGHPMPCNGEHETRGWKLHTNLSCVIACGQARLGGVYRFRTTSQITTEQLYGGLAHISTLTGGVLQGIPLHLVVRPMQVAPGGNPTKIYVVHIEIHATDYGDVQRKALESAQMRRDTARSIKAAQTEYRALLAAPTPGDDEDPEEQAAVGQEFHPIEDAVEDEKPAAAVAAMKAKVAEATKVPDPPTTAEWLDAIAGARTTKELIALGPRIDEHHVEASVTAAFAKRLENLETVEKAAKQLNALAPADPKPNSPEDVGFKQQDGDAF